MTVDGATRQSGTIGGSEPAPASGLSAQGRVVRAGALRALLSPGVAALYLCGTWDRPHRPEMLAVAAGMVAVAGLTYRCAAMIARLRAWQFVQAGGVLVTILGCAVLSLLDGGVAGPLGALVPFSLVYLAIVTPPRVFAGVAAVSAGAYAAVAVFGGPSPAGYPIVYALGMGGVAYGCLRQSATLASLRRRLADVSRIDPLTRCLNRRGFDERLEQELAEASRTGDPVTLLLADLDRFKEVNDVYGHQAGDELLAWTGRTLAKALRTHDVVGRLGGDEFGAILSGTGTDGARVVVDRLRQSLDGVVPASLGYAVHPSEASTVGALKSLADRRVYADKVARARLLPSADAVTRARSRTRQHGPARVSRRERRRRSIAHIGWNAVSNCAVGLLYGAFFAGTATARLPIALLCMLGALGGVLIIRFADQLSRSASARGMMIAAAAGLYGLAISATVLDGGLTSALGLGMLAPMPLVALGAPVRLAAALIGVGSALYVAVGVVVGASSGWYIAMQLAGILAVCVGCARQGRTAAQQRTLLTRLSVVDVLTDCLNRRGFEDRFAAELAHAHRTDRGVSLLIFDLDGFKQVNDTRGHAAGDDLLRWVGSTLTANLHPHDVVGRLGGDEFVVLLTSVSVPEADTAAERLRRALAERTSASVGLAVLYQDGDDFDALYAHADAELYADKGRRRSRGAHIADPMGRGRGADR